MHSAHTTALHGRQAVKPECQCWKADTSGCSKEGRGRPTSSIRFSSRGMVLQMLWCSTSSSKLYGKSCMHHRQSRRVLQCLASTTKVIPDRKLIVMS